MALAIQVENISKKYQIGVRRERYQALRDVIANTVKNLGRSADQGDKPEDFWALKDISFDVNVGDRIGIIGRNGAGKSTLLKLLSRITSPTSGRITLHGRVASLLEVGTGFHPELTGRENIYLNGAILGMSRSDIKRKFDEIVAFSEVEKFLETPVKRYSSGMYVRLAFAVAAHLEPDILIVDEVLAVGDSGFQKKCMGKMESVSKEGRTVLFVSHNMTAVTSLTTRCIELSQGRIVKIGESADVIEHYLAADADVQKTDGTFDLSNVARPSKVNPETAKVVLRKAECLDSSGRPSSSVREKENAALRIYFEVRSPIQAFEISMAVDTTTGVRVFSMLSDPAELNLQPGIYSVDAALAPNYLRPGEYSVGLSVYAPALQDTIKPAFRLNVDPSVEPENNVNWSYPNLGVVRLPYQFSAPAPAREFVNVKNERRKDVVKS
jgi:lipopolysaccharide transport system ATP-binding protein